MLIPQIVIADSCLGDLTSHEGRAWCHCWIFRLCFGCQREAKRRWMKHHLKEARILIIHRSKAFWNPAWVLVAHWHRPFFSAFGATATRKSSRRGCTEGITCRWPGCVGNGNRGMKLFPAFAGGVLAVAVVFMTYAVNAQPGWSPKEGAFPSNVGRDAGTGLFIHSWIMYPKLCHMLLVLCWWCLGGLGLTQFKLWNSWCDCQCSQPAATRSSHCIDVLYSEFLSPHGELRSITNSCQVHDVDIMGIHGPNGSSIPRHPAFICAFYPLGEIVWIHLATHLNSIKILLLRLAWISGLCRSFQVKPFNRPVKHVETRGWPPWSPGRRFSSLALAVVLITGIATANSFFPLGEPWPA